MERTIGYLGLKRTLFEVPDFVFFRVIEVWFFLEAKPKVWEVRGINFFDLGITNLKKL